MQTQSQQLVRAELGRELAKKVGEIRKVEGISFAKAWEVAKKRFPLVFAQAARIEAQDANESADEVVVCSEGVFTDVIDGKAVLMPAAYNDPWYH